MTHMTTDIRRHPGPATGRAAEAPVLLRTTDLVKHYDSRRGLWGRLTGRPGSLVRAVNGVSLDIRRGETMGIIGESGCGKSTLGRAILRLHEPTSGSVVFDGAELTELGRDAMMKMRRRMQIIFQDPYASLNPRKTVEDILTMPLKLHGLAKGKAARDAAAAMIENVGLKTAHLDRFPHQFSGGQRQRIGVARALILNPEFVVCDEPVSALDVSIQAQIIQLLAELKRELGLTYMFISHDIAVIGYVADRTAVMYLGEVVETGRTRDILAEPRHPYTQALLSAAPRLDEPGKPARIKLTGDLPSPLNPPPGCKFHTRCPHAMDICRKVAPAPVTDAQGHMAACHLIDGAGGKAEATA
ncbi:ABC transporter ATP-binding protein [Caenispirillum salinarum]|uniref:ABC transporter ATP-binding protein n=1 Tax=Caenispirillum salinarum TaxID=859058 RepID=UPI00384DF1B1